MLKLNQTMKEITLPLVSCITSCYKGEKYLPFWLEDLKKQTILDKIQIVLVHNEPSNKELEHVQKFMDEYPGVIKHIIIDQVEPLYSSWNRAIDMADAEYLAIWNIDDLRTSDSLEKQVNYLINNQDIDVVHGNFIITNDFSNKNGKLVDEYNLTCNIKEYTRSMILGPFFMWKKILCDKIGKFDEQFKSGADFCFAIRLATQSKIGFISDVLGYYLDQGQGASTNGDGKQPIERTAIEIRYGITDKIDENYIPLVEKYKYDIQNLYFDNQKHNIEKFIPNYLHFKEENKLSFDRKNMKTIVLMPTKNEDWILPTTLNAASKIADVIIVADQISTDKTREILANNSKVDLIDNTETGHSNKIRWKMLDYAREKYGKNNLYICLDADEIIPPYLFNKHKDKLLENIKLGTIIASPWVQIWRSINQYRDDNSVWNPNTNVKPFIFLDNGYMDYNRKFVINDHTTRVPEVGKTDNLTIRIPLLHFQFANWQRSQIKQAWYQCCEIIAGSDISSVNNKYKLSSDETNIKYNSVPSFWYNDIIISSNIENCDIKNTWHYKEIKFFYEKYGKEKFNTLNIWGSKTLYLIHQSLTKE